MRRVTVAARVDRANERRAVFAWANTVANGECFVRGNVVHMEYTEKPYDPGSDRKYQAIIRYFKQFPDVVIAEEDI